MSHKVYSFIVISIGFKELTTPCYQCRIQYGDTITPPPPHLVGRCPNVNAFSIFPSGGGVTAELKVVHAAVLDGVVGYVGVHDKVLETNALSPARRLGVTLRRALLGYGNGVEEKTLVLKL